MQYIPSIKKILISCLALLAGLSCNKTVKTETSKGIPVAKVNNAILYSNDLKHVSPPGMLKADSVVFIKSYINTWANNELFYEQALNYLSEEELNVDKEIEEYRKELISYKFQIKLINDKLDTIVSDDQIEEYYNANPQSFLLKSNIVKVLYIKTPISIPALDKLKKLCYSNNPKDAEVLKSLCIQYANNYYMNGNTWLMYDDLKKEMSQLKEVPEYSITPGKILEFTDAVSFYFLKIIDVKSKNTLSPLTFEKSNIRNMLINQRKQKLITAIKKDFFDRAKTNKEFEIYN